MRAHRDEADLPQRLHGREPAVLGSLPDEAQICSERG
jgi:hypothetical protein